jgi:hypothetical protein
MKVGLADVIVSLASDHNVVVTRRASGVMDANGIWVPGATTTIVIPSCSIQPATGMSRIVGGAEMFSDEQGQYTNDLRAVYSAVPLRTRTPTTEPDQLAFEGAAWIVTRVEKWVLNADIIYRAVITRETRGAS